jgi:hypothetical protein
VQTSEEEQGANSMVLTYLLKARQEKICFSRGVDERRREKGGDAGERNSLPTLISRERVPSCFISFTLVSDRVQF